MIDKTHSKINTVIQILPFVKQKKLIENYLNSRSDLEF